MKEEILKFFKGEAEDGKDTLLKYSRDASIFVVPPRLILFPKDAEDVKNLVRWVAQNKENSLYMGENGSGLSITARCAGTDMSGGAIGESIILDFTRHMNKLVSFTDNEITVQPGMFYRDFEKITLERGLILPCFTASKSINALGGMFGNNSAGERTLKYGKTEDYIAASKVVFADGVEYKVVPLSPDELASKTGQSDFEGRIYKNVLDLIKNNEEEIKKSKPKVHKNSAGYYIWNVVNPDSNRMDKTSFFDLNKLLVGSQGTLGIATEITFRLVPEPKYTRLLVAFLRDINLSPELVNKILKHKPQSLESYDDKTFLLVLKYLPSFAKLLGLVNFVKLFFSFWPEAIMTLKNGFPKLVFLVEFTGDSQTEADMKAEEAKRELMTIKKLGVRLTKGDFEAKKYWTIRHEAFNLIRFHLKKKKSMPFVDDVIVRPEQLPQFFPELYKILGEYGNRMTFAVGGHSGDGNMHIYTLLDPKDPALKEMIVKVSDQVYDLVSRLGGSITAEHNDGLIRTPYLYKMYNEKTLKLFKEIKEIFDSKNIFNPGKKVPISGSSGTKEYMENHIAE